jgi:sterol desaturase/sphingolipid hydroxylase (fatty acid hydroxylase superfamily)
VLKALFECHNEKLLSRRKFLRRLLKFELIAVMLILVSLVIGMAGYHLLEGLSWVDAFLNAAMLMGGMCPVNSFQADSGKIFAGVYAMYCGMVLLIVVGIFAVPILHRFLHHFHLESEKKQDQ